MEIKYCPLRLALISGVSPVKVFFHMFYTDANGDPSAIVEDCKTHEVTICWAGDVTFLDTPVIMGVNNG